MSYLDLPRVSFAGSFLATPSTINNAAINYYAYENPGPFLQGSPSASPASFANRQNFPEEDRPYVFNASWNPDGVAIFDFTGAVGGLVGKQGETVECGDPLIGATLKTVVEPNSAVAKLVDLDTNQQTLTQLYGVVVQLLLANGTVVFTAGMSEEAQRQNKLPVLTDLWFAKIPSVGGDSSASGVWQWVLDEIQWNTGDPLPPSVTELQDAYTEGISIKINVDMYNQNPPSTVQPIGHHGRIVGTLGPAKQSEPFSFVAGRRLTPLPGSQYWSGNFVVNEERQMLILDLGNSVPMNPAGSPLNLDTSLQAGLLGDSGFVPLEHGKSVPVTRYWYESYAGIVDIPLEPKEVTALETGPLYLWLRSESRHVPVLAESEVGWFVKPELSSARMSAGDTLEVKFWTIKRGVLSNEYDPELKIMPVNGPGQPLDPPPKLNQSGVPESGLTIAKRDSNQIGIRLFEVTANPIKTEELPDFRQWPGSQVYFLGGDWLQEGLPIPSVAVGFTILLWAQGNLPEAPTWEDVKNLLGGYAAMYPGMRGILDIGEQAIVDKQEHAAKMRTLMSLPVYDPRHMPVTRDMSPANTRLIINYLDSVLPPAV